MESVRVELVACIGKRVAAVKMFLEHSGIALEWAEGWKLRLARR